MLFRILQENGKSDRLLESQEGKRTEGLYQEIMREVGTTAEKEERERAGGRNNSPGTGLGRLDGRFK